VADRAQWRNARVTPRGVRHAGRFAKDQFSVDLAAQTVLCPAGVTTTIRPARFGGGTA